MGFALYWNCLGDNTNPNEFVKRRMNEMRKRKAFWGVTLACVLLLTSCGAQTSSAAPASQAPESTAQSESQHGNIFQNSDANVSEGRITVLTNVTEGDRLEELKKYAQEFDAKYPGTQTVESNTA